MRARRSGFTLIEILVVMAIIAVIAALSSAVWQRSQRVAKAAACMQNLRQIGAGLAQYLGDHDGAFPTLVLARDSKEQQVPTLDTELAAYVKEAHVFTCPDDQKNLGQITGTSYLWNPKLNGQKLAALTVQFVPESPLENPSRIMVIGDKEGWHPFLKNKLNVLYADCHVSQELTFLDDTAPAISSK